jgi:hypothetical protein
MSTENVTPPGGKEVRVVWPADTLSEPQVVNQFVISNDLPSMSGGLDGGIYLTFGHVSQPVLVDQRAVQKMIADKQPLDLDIQKLGTFYLSHNRARDLLEVLKAHLGADGVTTQP